MKGYVSLPGFTLLELLISIAIVVAMTAMVIVYLGGSNQRQELRLAADNVASLIRRAQINSLSGKQVNGAVPLGGFGVSIAQCTTAPCTVVTFADMDGDLDNDGSGETIETTTLPSNIIIPTVPGGSNVAIVFKPPQGLICVNRDCSNAGAAVITLQSLLDQSTRQVQVYKSTGQISVQ